MNKQVVWEAVKEPLRLLVLAIIPLLLVYFVSLPYEWAGVIILALRLLDKFLHEVGKETKNKRLIKGLTQF
jgi:hypothetical protein